MDFNDKGNIIFDESKLPEMRKKVFKKKLIRILLGAFFFTWGVYFFWLGLNPKGWQNETMRYTALYIGLPFLGFIAVCLILDALSHTFLKVYENGLSFPFRRYSRTIQKSEDYVNFNDLEELIIENDKIIIAKGKVNIPKERPIYISDISNINQFLKSVEGKVKLSKK